MDYKAKYKFLHANKYWYVIIVNKYVKGGKPVENPDKNMCIHFCDLDDDDDDDYGDDHDSDDFIKSSILSQSIPVSIVILLPRRYCMQHSSLSSMEVHVPT